MKVFWNKIQFRETGDVSECALAAFNVQVD